MALSDIDLVMLAKAARDETAFAELVRRHQAGVRAFLRKLTSDTAEADDIAQETLLKAYRRLSTFKGGASFRSWLYAIAYREFLQANRKGNARTRIADALADDARGGEPATPVDSSNLSMDLRRALGSLDEIERAAILLCDAVGLSHGEAAATLSTPLGSIKTYVARARDKMRAALENNPPPREKVEALLKIGAKHE